jgi:hypothetical protein
VQNYFNYFTEIETRFQARRGSILLLSTLDWALIEAWREAGVPLQAVLRGIDDAFDKYDARLSRAGGRLRKVNGLAWCAQSVMQATEAMREAAIGGDTFQAREPVDSGFEEELLAAFLSRNAARLSEAQGTGPAAEAIAGIAERLRTLAAELRTESAQKPEQLEATLTALESRLFASLTLDASEEEMLALREQAARELAPYRGKMSGVQLKQVTEQFIHKRLLEARDLPRLSLFYMDVA